MLLLIHAASSLVLAGCSSCPTTGVLTRASDSEVRSEFALRQKNGWLFRQSEQRRRPSGHASVLVTAPTQVDVPDPRPNSTEWWLRENTRLSKVMVICRGCLSATIADVSPPKVSISPATFSAQAIQ
jgi:hypothetical protein